MKTAITIAIAGAALVALPAMAQTADKTTTSPSTKTTTSSAQTEKKAPMYEMKPGQWRATKLKGVDVYNASNDKIGSISELIVDREGKIEAVVIGVGGFLGMGEHDVAVPFNQVKWVDEPVNKTASSTGTTTGSGTSTTSNNTATGTSTAPTTSTSSPSAGGTRTTTTGTTTTSRDHTYPDHAVVNMTKDQLKALPEVKYGRS